MIRRIYQHFYPPTPETPEQRAERELKEALGRLAAARAAHGTAPTEPLNARERLERANAVGAGQIAVARAKANLDALKVDPAAEASYMNQVREARRETINQGRQAARLIMGRVRHANQDPGFTFVAPKTQRWDVATGRFVQAGPVRGWLLFREASFEAQQRVSPRDPLNMKWVPLYHGPYMDESGEIRAFYDLVTPSYTPGSRSPAKPVNLTNSSEVRIMDYATYRGVASYTPHTELLVAEHTTQQAIADLLQQHHIVP